MSDYHPTSATTGANILPYSNNWNLYSALGGDMTHLFDQDLIQNEKEHPMLHLTKEKFGLLVTDIIHKFHSEFEPLGTNLMLVRMKKMDPLHRPDFVYTQDFFCYSKIRERLEIGIDEIMFTGASCNPTSKLVSKLVAYGELGLRLAACITSTDLILIRGIDWCFYDAEDKSLTLNKAQVGEGVCPGCGRISGVKSFDGGKLDIIRFPIDPQPSRYWCVLC